MTFEKAESGTHVLDQAFMGDAAVILQQGAVETEIDAKHLRYAEREVAVRNGKQDRLGQQGAKELDFRTLGVMTGFA